MIDLITVGDSPDVKRNETLNTLVTGSQIVFLNKKKPNEPLPLMIKSNKNKNQTLRRRDKKKGSKKKW